MALSNLAGVSPIPFVAGGAIEINRFVKLDSTAGRVVAATAPTEAVVGVSLSDADAAGDQVSVQIAGVARVVASGAVSLGDEVEVGAGGKVTTAGGATALSVGVALSAASADGEVIEVLLAVPGVKRPANS
jgi:hypothetical protein